MLAEIIGLERFSLVCSADLLGPSQSKSSGDSDSARNYCAAHTRDGGGNHISTPTRLPRWGPRFCRGLSVATAGLRTSADLRRSLALSKRFPDCRLRPAARYRSLAQKFPADQVWLKTKLVDEKGMHHAVVKSAPQET